MSSVHEEEAENQFTCLPDDVVVNILDKVSDIKWLSRCVLVSKRFAALMPLVQVVSIKGGTLDKCSNSGMKNPVGNGLLGKLSNFLINNLVLKPFRYRHKLALSPPLPWNDSCFRFLVRFEQVRSLNLELASDFNSHNDSLFKWGADFTARHHSVTVLCAKSISKTMIEYQEELEDGTELEITREELIRRKSLGLVCVKAAVHWLAILSVLLLHLPMLQSLTISDSMNKGVNLCMIGEKLVECRKTLNFGKVGSMCRNWTRENLKVGYVPVLELPVSGYVMKGVTVVNFRMFAAGDNSGVEPAMVEAFAEEQGVFSEAVVQILEKHRDGMQALLHP